LIRYNSSTFESELTAGPNQRTKSKMARTYM